MVEITEKDFGVLALCSLRYCQGRRTYMPSWVQQIVADNIQYLSDNDLKCILRDLENQEEDEFLYGDPKIDKPNWLDFKQKVEKEIESRKANKKEDN